MKNKEGITGWSGKILQRTGNQHSKGGKRIFQRYEDCKLQIRRRKE